MSSPEKLNGYRVVMAAPLPRVAEDAQLVLVDAETKWVVASWRPNSFGEWFWGHYFGNLSDAVAYFNNRAAGGPA